MAALNKGVVGSILFEMKSWMRFLLPTKYVAVYYPTPDAVIDRMLKLAEVSNKDVVYDLGCGDGRVLTTAASRLGARGVGVELDPQLAAVAQEGAAKAQVEHLVKIVQGDAHKVDVSDATVIALYLSERGNKALLGAVGSKMRPGTKVVSFFFPVEGWEQQLVKVDSQDNMSVYLYKYGQLAAAAANAGAAPAPGGAAGARQGVVPGSGSGSS